MMCFADLSQIPQIAICAFFVVLSAAFLLFFLLGLLNRKERAWIHLLFALPSYGIFQLLYDYHGSVYQMNRVHFDINAGDFPLPAIGAAALLLLLLFAWSLSRFAGQRDVSVKEAVDDLPTGICCYLENGRVLLVNETMERISLALTGRAVLNGRELCDAVLPKEVGKHAAPVRAFGRSYSFERSGMPGLEGVTQLLAADVTEEYGRLEEVREKNRQLEEQSRRLSAAIGESERLSIEKEYLDAKIKVHSGIGELLSATAKVIREADLGTSPSEETAAALFDRWNQLPAALLDVDARPRSSYDAVLKAAKDVGVNIVLDGTLPEAEPQRSVLLAAIGECITNTFRHAEGDTLTIRCREGEMVFTNNGKAPEGPVVEKGGLANLRRLAEDAGAEMTVESSPVFRLTIRWE